MMQIMVLYKKLEKLESELTFTFASLARIKYPAETLKNKICTLFSIVRVFLYIYQTLFNEIGNCKISLACMVLDFVKI